MPDPPSSSQEQELFRRALTLPTEEYEQFLERIDDDALRDRLARLLTDTEVEEGAIRTGAPVRAAATLVAEESEPRRYLGRRVGHVRLVELLGEGGMGRVYKGFDEWLQRPVAVKTLLGSERLPAVTRERLLHEARALSRIEHPNVCRVYDLFDDGGYSWLAMEMVEGTLLHRYLEGRSLPDHIAVATGVARALVALHEAGVVHRDVKPSNVVVDASGTPKLLDFGISLVDPEPQTDGGSAARVSLAGTPGFMSPEQRNGEAVGPATDVFSFGLVLRQCFEALSDGSQAVAEASALRHLDELVDSMTELDPEHRPSARDVLRRLLGIAGQPRARARARRRAWAATSILGGLLAVGWLGWWLGHPEPLIAPEAAGRVLILPIDNQTGRDELQWVEDGLIELVRTSLRQVERIEPVPVDPVLVASEEALSDPAVANEADLTELGRRLGADLVVRTTLRQEDEELALDFETYGPRGKLEQHRLSDPDPLTLADRLARRLVLRMRPGSSAPAIADLFSPDPFVNRLYAIGVDRLARRGPDLAEPYFLACLDQEPELSWARLRRAEVRLARGEPQQAVTELRALIEQPLPPPVAYESQLLLGRILRRQGRWQEATDTLTRAEELARQLREPSSVARVLEERAELLQLSGEVAASLDVWDSVIDTYEQIHDRRSASKATLQKANAYILNGETKVGLELLNRIDREIEARDEPWLWANLQLSRGNLLARSGDWDAAEELVMKGLAYMQKVGDVAASVGPLNTLAVRRLYAGQLDAAARDLTTLRELGRRVGDVDVRANAAMNLGLIEVYRRRPQSAAVWFDEADSFQTWQGRTRILLCNRSQMVYETGDYARALRMLDRCRSRLESEMRGQTDPFRAAFARAVAQGRRVRLPTDYLYGIGS